MLRCDYRPASTKLFCIVLISSYAPFLTLGGEKKKNKTNKKHHQMETECIIRTDVQNVKCFRRTQGQQAHFMLLTFAIYGATPGLNEKEMKDPGKLPMIIHFSSLAMKCTRLRGTCLLHYCRGVVGEGGRFHNWLERMDSFERPWWRPWQLIDM